ncbi:MAG: glycosyl transferase [Magnetococcales bacterium]|nr:glycosyl transferase [Magnetococcales bacterium]
MAQEWDIQTLVSMADGLLRAGDGSGMKALYLDWIAGNGDHPVLYMIQYNLGVSLVALGDLEGARDAYLAAIQRNPDFYPSYINLGNVLERLVSPEAAANCWRQMVERLSGITADSVSYRNSALKQIGRVSSLDEQESALRQALELDPFQHEVMEYWITSRQNQCKWPVIEPFVRCSREHLLTGFAPISLAAYSDDPLWQLANAYMYNKTATAHASHHYLDAHAALRATAGVRPRVGYLSSDLRMHAMGFLMVELFERHDPEQVELYYYYTGETSEENDPIHRRIRAAAPRWRVLHGLSDEEAARQIMADRIEILVDLNGYTFGARLKMLSMRPAPVVVNWLGYPGSMGSPYHHYIIADPFVIPPEHEMFYSERVVRLPCYQANDSRRQVSEHRPTRSEAGLPENKVVFCCFNAVRKITALTWGLWCQILQQVPDSVMWLMHENDAARDRLRELATGYGVDPERLLFAPPLVNANHLARYPLVDLVLDCFPYGAHTTASDALWMGVPILTLAGLSFPSRVCGSLVSAAGLPDLVCATPEEYVERAVQLGNQPERLREVRARLHAAHDRCVLFDMTNLARRLEALYREMQQDFLADRVPRPDLTNLERYQEIGIALDPLAGGWRGNRAALFQVYEERLAALDRLCYLGPDARLWRPETRARLAAMVREGFLEKIVRHDDAQDLSGVIENASGGDHPIAERIAALPVLLGEGRVQSAFIVSMVLANGGTQHPWVSVGLWAGGVLFDSAAEEERGYQAWCRQVGTLAEPLRIELQACIDFLTGLLTSVTWQRPTAAERIHRFRVF